MTDSQLSTSPKSEIGYLTASNKPHRLPALKLNATVVDKRPAVHLPNVSKGQPLGNFLKVPEKVPESMQNHMQGRGGGMELDHLGSSSHVGTAQGIFNATTTTIFFANRPSLSQSLPDTRSLPNTRFLHAHVSRYPQENKGISEATKSSCPGCEGARGDGDGTGEGGDAGGGAGGDGIGGGFNEGGDSRNGRSDVEGGGHIGVGRGWRRYWLWCWRWTRSLLLWMSGMCSNLVIDGQGTVIYTQYSTVWNLLLWSGI